MFLSLATLLSSFTFSIFPVSHFISTSLSAIVDTRNLCWFKAFFSFLLAISSLFYRTTFFSFLFRMPNSVRHSRYKLFDFAVVKNTLRRYRNSTFNESKRERIFLSPFSESQRENLRQNQIKLSVSFKTHT